MLFVWIGTDQSGFELLLRHHVFDCHIFARRCELVVLTSLALRPPPILVEGPRETVFGLRADELRLEVRAAWVLDWLAVHCSSVRGAKNLSFPRTGRLNYLINISLLL